MRSQVFFFIIYAIAALPSNAEITAQEILRASDKIRNPDKPFSMITELAEFRDGVPIDATFLSIYSKLENIDGQYRSLVRFQAPARDAGKLMLKDGNILWFHDSNSRATIRLSPQQRLLGQAANGDVVLTNFSFDYDARIVAEEKVTDTDKVDHTCFKLELLAKNPNVTYSKIEYWVEKDSFRPIKSKFYAESGRLLKIAFYRQFEMQLGKERPTETIIIDGLNPMLITRMRFSEYRYKDIPDAWFQKSALSNLRLE